MLLVENLFPVQIGIMKYWIGASLHNKTMTVMYTGYRHAAGTHIGYAKEKGVVHFPQFIVVCR
jgi:hypothetical protein